MLHFSWFSAKKWWSLIRLSAYILSLNPFDCKNSRDSNQVKQLPCDRYWHIWIARMFFVILFVFNFLTLLTVDGEAFCSPMASSKVPMFWKQTAHIFTLRISARFKRLAKLKRPILRTPYSLPLNVVGLSFMILAAPSLLPQSGQAGDSGTEVIELPLDEERTSQWTPIDSTCITGETRTSWFFFA